MRQIMMLLGPSVGATKTPHPAGGFRDRRDAGSRLTLTYFPFDWHCRLASRSSELGAACSELFRIIYSTKHKLTNILMFVVRAAYCLTLITSNYSYR